MKPGDYQAAEPDVIAGLVSYLIRPESWFVTGTLPVSRFGCSFDYMVVRQVKASISTEDSSLTSRNMDQWHSRKVPMNKQMANFRVLEYHTVYMNMSTHAQCTPAKVRLTMVQ